MSQSSRELRAMVCGDMLFNPLMLILQEGCKW